MLIHLGDHIVTQTLHLIQRMRHRLDPLRIHGLHLREDIQILDNLSAKGSTSDASTEMAAKREIDSTSVLFKDTSTLHKPKIKTLLSYHISNFSKRDKPEKGRQKPGIKPQKNTRFRAKSP